MGKKNEDVPAPQATVVAEPVAATPSAMYVLATDEHAGKGGSYIFDPATGSRTRVPPEDKESA